jgi:nucleoside-diphosphate-sugar epimerase
MKVFVAGAAGPAGRRMIPQLLAAGHAVVAMTRDRVEAESLERAGADTVGWGRRVTSFIHVDDAASAAVAALDAPTSGIFNILDNEPAFASEWMPAYARVLGAPPPRRVPVLLARLVLGKSLTEWITTRRGASNRAAVSAPGWKPRFPSWREGFAPSLSSQG